MYVRGHPTFIQVTPILCEGNFNIWASFCTRTVIEVCHLHLVGVIISWLFIEQEHHDLSGKVDYLPLIRSKFPKTCMEPVIVSTKSPFKTFVYLVYILDLVSSMNSYVYIFCKVFRVSRDSCLGLCLHLSPKVSVPIVGMSNPNDSFGKSFLQMITWVFPIMWTIGPRTVYILSTHCNMYFGFPFLSSQALQHTAEMEVSNYKQRHVRCILIRHL